MKPNRIPKVSKAAGSRFIAQLLMPVLDAELHDPEMKRLEERARRAARKRAGDIWHKGYLQVMEAECLNRAANYRRIIEERGAGCIECAQAERRFYDEVARQMALPAAEKQHIAWKRKHKFVGGQEAKFAPLIADDEARLEKVKA